MANHQQESSGCGDPEAPYRRPRQPGQGGLTAKRNITEKSKVPTTQIESLIFRIRGQNVMFDKDLAALYSVTTFNLNKAVTRNIERFPDDFMFRLTRQELNDLKFHFGTSSRSRPIAHGEGVAHRLRWGFWGGFFGISSHSKLWGTRAIQCCIRSHTTTDGTATAKAAANRISFKGLKQSIIYAPRLENKKRNR